MILPDLYQYLASLSLCDAIYPELLPQTHSLPAILLELDGDNDEQLMDGSIGSLHRALVTVICYDPSILVANNLATSVKNALAGYVGPLGSATAQCIYKEEEFSAPVTDTGLRGVSLQFNIAYYQ